MVDVILVPLQFLAAGVELAGTPPISYIRIITMNFWSVFQEKCSKFEFTPALHCTPTSLLSLFHTSNTFGCSHT